jgi:hypothetical protein
MRFFPMMLIVVIIYSLIVLGVGVTHSHADATLDTARTIHLFSGDDWKISVGDILVILGLALLFVEIVKATRTTHRALINHGLSMVTFVIALIEFITLRGFGTSTFFFILMMCFFDVVAGYTISVLAAEHDLGVGRPGTD